jgi:hypothetical protein
MDAKNANELDRLLADGELSGPEADAIFDRVYEQVARTERVVRPKRVAFVIAGCAAAAAVLLQLRTTLDGPDEFAARGGSAATVLEAICSEGSLDACPTTAKLAFLAAGDGTTGFLSAYAEPLDPSAGAERVWYFSRETESPQLTAGADGTRVFERAVRLTGTHRTGRYRVHAFLADHPLGRDDMLGAVSRKGVLASVQIDLTVVER